MANKKITELTSATLPLDNTELIPIVQGGETKKVVVSDLKSDKQDTLVSGTNIKTVNGNSLLGSGDLVVGGGFSIISTIDSPSVVGTSANTILVADVLIPANTIQAGDNVYFSMSGERVVSVSGNTGFTLAIAPTSGITDPSAGALTYTYKLVAPVMTGTNKYMNSDHILKIKGTSNTVITNYIDFSDKTQGLIRVSSNNIDWSVNQYLYIYVGNVQATTDTKITGFRFERKRTT